jgi:anti-sigma factor (TIGR02949 family)
MSDHSCAEILSKVNQFIDGELDAASVEEIKVHLIDCVACLEAFDFEADVRRIFGERARVCCSEEFKTRLTVVLSSEGAVHAVRYEQQVTTRQPHPSPIGEVEESG